METKKIKGQEAAKEEKNLTFWEHLEEFRWMLLRVIGILILFMVGCFIAMPYVFDDFVLGPTTSDFFLYKWMASLGKGPFLPDFGNDDYHIDIQNINVASQFMTHITTSFWFSLVLMFPYLIFEVWRFIKPALYPKEERSVGIAFASGTLMFFLGCALGYSLVFPFTFRFLTEYQLSELIENKISLNSYMSNFLTLIFVMGVVFELPLLAWVLSKMGLITKEFLQKHRKYAVVILMVLAAIITPSGDPFTLMIVFLPLFLLYELGIIFAKKAAPKEEEEEEETEEIEEIDADILDD